MGFIRGGLSVFLIVLLFISVLLSGVFLALTWSLGYENVQKELTPVVREIAEEQSELIGESFNLIEEMDRAFEVMQQHCTDNNLSYAFSAGGYSFVIPCDTLNELEQNPNALVDKGIGIIIEQIYYQNYDCNFWDCFVKTGLPLFLVSEKAKNYWKEKFYFTLLAAIILIVLVFLLAEQKINTPVVFGSVLIIVAFILTRIEKLIAALSPDSSLSIVGVFFSKTGSVFWIFLIFGILVLGSGIILRFWNIEGIKKKLSKKDVRKMINEEKSREKSVSGKKTSLKK